MRKDVGLACPAQTGGTSSSAAPRRTSRLRAPTRAAPSLLVVAEHYDKGWRATLDGKPAQTVQADLSAIGVALPAGQHEVSLHFVPDLLWLGLLLCAGCVAALLLLELLHRDDRVGAAESK